MKITKTQKVYISTFCIIIGAIIPVTAIMKMEPLHIDAVSVLKSSMDYKHYETSISSINLGSTEMLEVAEKDETRIESKQITNSINPTENNPKEQNISNSQKGTVIETETIPKVQKESDLSGYLNSYVLDIIKTYGKTPYLLNNDYENYNGVTTTLYYQDQVLLKAHPSGNRASHCSGITFEVFFKAMQRRNQQLGIPKDDFNGMNWDQMFDFILHWYAAQGPKSQSNITVALEKYGLGVGIKDFEDARPGDFIDISRENNTGHTGVFLNWVREGDKIIGVRHWSSQGTTGGISNNTEYFNVRRADGRKYGNVIINRVYIGRVLPVGQYKK